MAEYPESEPLVSDTYELVDLMVSELSNLEEDLQNSQTLKMRITSCEGTWMSWCSEPCDSSYQTCGLNAS